MTWTDPFASMTNATVANPVGGGAGTPVLGSVVDYEHVMNDHAAVWNVTWTVDPAGATVILLVEGSLDNVNFYQIGTASNTLSAETALSVFTGQPARYVKVSASVNAGATASAVVSALLIARE